MSYQTMDHAGWVESNIAASKRMAANSKGRKVRSDVCKGFPAAPDTLSPFQAKVFDILGMVGGGIYNAPISWDAIQWKGAGHGICVPWSSAMSTWGFHSLTMLVFLCHEARIRCSVRPHGPRCLLLSFYPGDEGSEICRCHPNLDEAVAKFRGYLPAGHRITYVAEVTQ